MTLVQGENSGSTDLLHLARPLQSPSHTSHSPARRRRPPPPRPIPFPTRPPVRRAAADLLHLGPSSPPRPPDRRPPR
jgi:hypothetical protein